MSQEKKSKFSFSQNRDESVYKVRIRGSYDELGSILANQINLMHLEPEIKRDIVVVERNVSYSFPYEILTDSQIHTDQGKQELIDRILGKANASNWLVISERVVHDKPDISGATIRNPDLVEASAILAHAAENPAVTLYIAKNEPHTKTNIKNIVFNSADTAPDLIPKKKLTIMEAMRAKDHEQVAVTIVRSC